MKNLCMAIALLAVTFSYGQWPFEKIQGDGHVTKETRSIGNYTAVSSSGFWDVMIAYGESNSIQLEGDENLLPYIETKVEDGKLTIKSKKNANLRSKNKMTIYVSLTRMTGISLSGSGDMIGKGKFENAGNTDVKLSGSGSINIDFNKVSSLDLSISGSGSIRLSGTSRELNARISGSGNADCSGLNADAVTAMISGSGNIKVYANQKIEARISGSGNVYYKGAANEVSKHVSGSGRVIKS